MADTADLWVRNGARMSDMELILLVRDALYRMQGRLAVDGSFTLGRWANGDVRVRCQLG